MSACADPVEVPWGVPWGVEMALTDHCDIYAAVDEEAANRIVHHLMRQRPSLFNYASAYIAANPKLACAPVERTTDIDLYNNPLFQVEPPLPLVGVDAPPVALNYCAQLVDAEIDFSPGNRFQLPQELNPPLPTQRLALKLRIWAGLDCPMPEFIDGIQPWSPGEQARQSGRDHEKLPQPPPLVPPTRRLLCFCLDLFALGHLEIDDLFGEPHLVIHIDAVDIVDIKPDALENVLNCYIRSVAELILREKLTFPVLGTFLLNLPFLKLPKVTVSLTANPPAANNPAVEDDQVKVFIDLAVAP